MWDLYINNATCEPAMIGSKTGDDAAAEFAMGEAVFYQNGTWGYGQVTGYEVADEDMGMMPIYIALRAKRIRPVHRFRELLVHQRQGQRGRHPGHHRLCGMVHHQRDPARPV